MRNLMLLLAFLFSSSSAYAGHYCGSLPSQSAAYYSCESLNQQEKAEYDRKLDERVKAAHPELGALQELIDRSILHPVLENEIKPKISNQNTDVQTPIDKYMQRLKEQENKVVPKFSGYGTDMQSIRKYIQLLQSTSLEACIEAAMEHSVDGAYCVAKKHENDKNYFKLIKEASRLGHPLAKSDFAHILEESYNLNNEYSAEIHTLLLSAAQSGIPHAQVSVGWYSMTGELGFPVDYAQAMTWNLEAYNQGHSEGANNIGELYEKGFGVRKSKNIAVIWYKKAGELGNKEATQRVARLTTFRR